MILFLCCVLLLSALSAAICQVAVPGQPQMIFQGSGLTALTFQGSAL